ncbi:MAG: hypothetical protein IKZ31_00875 [Lentisphaeria bacterium]|nr:hypothetical protein [Lentisphaeria bacterium]
MMKNFMTLALVCSAVLLTAQDLWDGKAESLSVGTYKTTGTNVQVADGVITATGKTTGEDKYTYVTLHIKTAPFTLNGKKLAVTAWGGDSKPGDSLYVKAKSVGNKNVLSAMKWGQPGLQPKQYTIVPEQKADLDWIPHQINAPIDAPIIGIDVIFGRRGAGNDLKLMVKDIKLVD